MDNIQVILYLVKWQQSRLPKDGKPLCFILYADKTKLSSFGTAKGYPVIARLAGLPVDIRNGNGTGGGRVVGWLPVVGLFLSPSQFLLKFVLTAIFKD